MAPEDQCAELFTRNRERLLTMCADACKGHVNEANDLLQDIMINVWQQWDTIRPDATQKEVDAWLFYKSRTVIHNFLRHNHLRWVSIDTVDIANFVDNNNTGRERIESIMESRSEEEQQLLRLLLQGYNSREIAEMKGIKHSAQRKQIYRLFEKIRKKKPDNQS